MNSYAYIYTVVLLIVTISSLPQVTLGKGPSKSERFKEKDEDVVCLKTERSLLFRPKPRRYDIEDMGWETFFHGWADVQGQGAANDYCRVVGYPENKFLSCELAGSSGAKTYNSATEGFDLGYHGTWYMRDQDGDGRDDYCRCVTKDSAEQVVCTRAGPLGFFGSLAHGNNTDINFSPTGPLECRTRPVFPEFGKAASQ